MEVSMDSTNIAKSPPEAGREDLAPQQVRYQQLTRADQSHAEALVRSCRLSLNSQISSHWLAYRSLVQSFLTLIPLVAADFVTLWALLLATTAIIERLCGLPHNLVTINTAIVASLLLLPIAQLSGLYPALGTGAVVEFRQLVQSAGAALFIFSGIGIVASPVNWPYFLAASFLTLLLAVPVLPAARFTARCLASRCSWWGAPTLIFANADNAEELFGRIRSMQDRGLRPVAVLLSSSDYWSHGKRLEERGIPVFDVHNALDCALRYKATWILIATGADRGNEPWDDSPETDAVINAIPNRVLLSAGRFEYGIWDRATTIGMICGLLLSSSRHSGSRAFVKRALDVIVSLSVMLMASPLLLGIAAAIRLSSPGPIFYSQERIGRGGRKFAAWKFRSMLPDADRLLQHHLDHDPELRREWQATHKLKHDPRVTWIGRLLRAISFDELPQLWNILCGEMSLVGPRPIVDSSTYDAAYVHDYPEEYAAYTSVRPGLTGLWQVTCRNSGVYEMRIYWDMYYIRNWSLWLDLYIILRTIRTVLLCEGAS